MDEFGLVDIAKDGFNVAGGSAGEGNRGQATVILLLI